MLYHRNESHWGASKGGDAAGEVFRVASVDGHVEIKMEATSSLFYIKRPLYTVTEDGMHGRCRLDNALIYAKPVLGTTFDSVDNLFFL